MCMRRFLFYFLKAVLLFWSFISASFVVSNQIEVREFIIPFDEPLTSLFLTRVDLVNSHNLGDMIEMTCAHAGSIAAPLC